MPTFRKDLHLGHDVATIDTDDIVNGAITEEKMADDSVSTRTLQDECVTEPKLADDAVSTRTIQDEAVTPEKLSDRVATEYIDPLLDPLREKDKDLQNQIDSFNEHGLSVSNHFGDDPHIGISQKTLTEAFNKLWNKLEDITGEVLRGISMEVTPVYFTGNDGCTVHIKAMTVDTTGIFEQIYFYWNNSLEPFAGSDTPTSYFEFDTELMNTAVLKCRAKIMGIWYEEQELIVHNDFFWLGAGPSYQSIFNDAHRHSADSCCMRGNYDISCGEGNRIYFIIADAAKTAFQRADMNGIEIAFTESTFMDDYNNVFRVYTSENTYQAGTYNIDING